MSYQKKEGYPVSSFCCCILLAYICRFIETDNELIQTLA